MSKPTKYARVGEFVKVIKPMRFDRIGYPMTVADIDPPTAWETTPLAKERNAILDRLVRAYVEPDLNKQDSFVLSISTTMRPQIDHRIETHLKNAANLSVLIKHNFGGNDRKIYEHDYSSDKFDEANYAQSNVWMVGRRKIVKTGVRHKGWSSYVAGSDADYDGEGPRLHDQQTHCIYSLRQNHKEHNRFVWLTILAKYTERLHRGAY